MTGKIRKGRDKKGTERSAIGPTSQVLSLIFGIIEVLSLPKRDKKGTEFFPDGPKLLRYLTEF